MSISDVLEEIEDNRPELKMTPRIFAQIEPLWPKGKNGQPISTVARFAALRKTLLEQLIPIGYVNVAKGIGTVSSVCPGYWIILKSGNQFWRFKMGETRDEFIRNLKRIPEWKEIGQLFL